MTRYRCANTDPTTKPSTQVLPINQLARLKIETWSHLAMRYFPTRVDKKCKEDPSLGGAHGCFWKYHPERAWAWELRLQQEIAADFRIEEKPYRSGGGDVEHRTRLLLEHPKKALEIVEKEIVRRRRDADGNIVSEFALIESGL